MGSTLERVDFDILFRTRAVVIVVTNDNISQLKADFASLMAARYDAVTYSNGDGIAHLRLGKNKIHFIDNDIAKLFLDKNLLADLSDTLETIMEGEPIDTDHFDIELKDAADFRKAGLLIIKFSKGLFQLNAPSGPGADELLEFKKSWDNDQRGRR